MMSRVGVENSNAHSVSENFEIVRFYKEKSNRAFFCLRLWNNSSNSNVHMSILRAAYSTLLKIGRSLLP